MKRPVYIRQVSAVSALGYTAKAIFDALMETRTGIREINRFDCSNYASSLCATVPELDSVEPGQATFRLLDILLGGIESVPADSLVFLATTKGGIDQLQHQCREGNPGQASTGEIHHTLDWIRKRLNTSRPGININAACASSTIAIAKAASLIRNGFIDDCVVAAYDILSEFTQSGFSAIRASSDQMCRPFDAQRSGLNLGESAAFIHLSHRAQAVNSIPLVSIDGYGISSDAAHITAPARDACGLIRACRQAFDSSSLTPESVAAISAHGTGTVYNDAMEMTGFETLFGDSMPPFFSVKGSTGHTLGTSGALETIISLLSLKHGSIPPTVGCKQPDEKAQGKVGEVAQKITKGAILKTNSGFGGINAALLLSLVL